MASINKLSIRGVRAFSPDDEEQVIEFYYPCTVIVGANGCGKTTIIEALKYAVTGALPPGAGKGQAFVHDPKAMGQSAVKACVKLRFTNRAGTPMVVTRSMELTQKKTTLSFKALDGVLRTTDPHTGERISMSHKCAELDKQIPTLMGVSKPVLENVVFCHQEDSSWPLMEGAVLKKKFDDIFDSTRYAKALDELRSIAKEYTGVAKDLKVELSGLASHKHAAQNFRQELLQLNENVEELEEEIGTYRNECKDVDEMIERTNEITRQVEEAQDDLDVQQSHLEGLKSLADQQRSMLRDNDLTNKHTLKELQTMLGDFDDKMGLEIDRKVEMEEQVTKLNSEIRELNQKETDLKIQIGKLETERDAHRQLEQDRLQKMETIAQTYAIELPVTQDTQESQGRGGDTLLTGTQDDTTVLGGGTSQERDSDSYTIAENDINLFMRGLDSKERDLQKDLDHQRQDAKDTEDRLSKALAKFRGEAASIQSDIDKLNTKRIETRDAMDKLSANLGKSRIRKHEIDEYKRKAARAIEDRDKCIKNDRRNEIPTEIISIERKCNRVRVEIQEDQETLQHLRRNQETQQQITLLKDQAMKAVGGLRDDIREERDALQDYCDVKVEDMNGMGGGNEDCGEALEKEIQEISQSVESLHSELKDEVEESSEQLDDLKKVLSEKSALLSHNQQALDKARDRIGVLTGDGGSVRNFKNIVKEVRMFEATLGPVSTSSDVSPLDLSKILAERIEDISSDGINHAAIARVISKLKKMSKPPKGEERSRHLRCPCCLRDMDTDEVRVFQDTMELMKDVANSPFLKPSELEENALDKYRDWKEEVAGCMIGISEYERVMPEKNELKEIVAKLESEVKSKKSELKNLSRRHSTDEDKLTGLNNLLQETRRWLDDASRISQLRFEIDSNEKKDMNMSMSLPADSNRDLDTVERDLRERNELREQLMAKINRLNKEMNQINNDITTKTASAAQQEQLARDVEAKFAAEQEATIKRNELKEQLQTINDEESKAQELVAPLQQKIQDKEFEQSRIRNLARSEEDKIAKSVNQFREDVNRLKELNERISRYYNSDKDDEHHRLTSKIARLVEKARKKADDLKVLQPELEKLVKSVSDQENHKQTIKDNIQQMHYQQQIGESEVEMSRLEQKLRNIEGAEDCERDLNRAEKRKRDILGHIAHNEGRRGGIVDQIRLLKRKLKTEEYDNIEQRYRVANIKHTTTVTAVKDLDKYHAALDSALQQYHSIKIQDINKIIRELWTLTYKGEDITNIELDSSKETSARTKRSYNYRVVMTKGTSKMDMRGRCSAGQRVLACIVIRLALAETFCVNCGVIALDEPTVNLDDANKAGLAISLAQIIAHRAKQNNFQLITITHDEDFVGMMKRHLATQSGFDMPEKFFQVSREEAVDGKYYSKIHAVDWEELT